MVQHTEMKDTVPVLDSKGAFRPLEDIEKDIILYAIAYHDNNLALVTKSLKIARATLYRKLWKLGFFKKLKNTNQTIRR